MSSRTDEPPERAEPTVRMGGSGSLGVHNRSLIRHLPYFAVVAEEGHFHRAAARLNITQPALSRRIQALEEDMGVALFTRTLRVVRLTPAGEAFREDVERILRDLGRSVGRAVSVSRGDAGHLQLALNERSMRSKLVIEAIHEFQTTYPDVVLNLFVMLSEAQLLALRREELDAGFIVEVAVDEMHRASLELMPIADDPFLLALHKDHRLANKPRLQISDLRDEPLVWPSRAAGRALSDEMIAAFRAAGVSPNIAFEVPTAEATISIAAAKLGCGFILGTDRLPASVITRQVEDLTLRSSLQLVWTRGKEQPALARFVEIIRRRLDAEIAPSSRPVG